MSSTLSFQVFLEGENALLLLEVFFPCFVASGVSSFCITFLVPCSSPLKVQLHNSYKFRKGKMKISAHVYFFFIHGS